jgi:acyl-coenzyme A thioesterase PaaI-like protein
MTDAQQRAAGDLLAEGLHADARGHFIGTMGFEFGKEPDDRHALASVVIDPYIQAEGLPWPNAATLLTLVDILVGRLASYHTAPRISVTANLGLRLFDPPVGERIEFQSELIKVGRTMTVGVAQLYAAGSGRLVGTSLGTFMASPRPVDQAPHGFPPVSAPRGKLVRSGSLNDQIGLRMVQPGVAELAALETDLANATQSLQGGATALLGEAAIYGAVGAVLGGRQVIDSLEVHYLAAGRLGPFRATAQVLHHDSVRSFCQCDVADLGSDRVVAVIEATTRALH